MLIEMVVENVGVIGRAELSLERGCSALTGETGAGKTLVVAALGLLLGGRAERTLVRRDAEAARVEGRFWLRAGHPAIATLAAHGMLDEEPPAASSEGIEVVVSRSLGADGRGRARVNGRIATVGALSEIGRHLVEIAGQNEYQSLGSAAVQRRLLDSYGGPEAVALAGEVAEEVRAAARAEAAASRLADEERARSRELDVLRFEIAEIERADIAEGESEQLAAEARRLEHATSIAAGLSRAGSALGGEAGAQDRLDEAARELEALTGMDPALGILAERLAAAQIEVTDIAQELSGRVVEPDPGALEAARSRLAVLSRLKRKYGDDEGQILQYLGRARARLEEVEAGEGELVRHRGEAESRRARALELASSLRELRKDAAVRLTGELQRLLSELALPHASVEIELDPRPLYEGGTEGVELLIAAGPGEAPRPVSRVASGGELSRIALALHVLTSAGGAQTMVFDEVDAGVGGRAAQAVGRCLSRLARDGAAQVLVVTHLPQVAAFADAHFRVSRARGGPPDARVERIEGPERVEELSRMLAGLPESERAREHAQELLEMASEGAANP